MSTRKWLSAAVRSSESADFEWRAPLGAWRWLILGTLGVGSSACGGRAETPPSDESASGATGGSNGLGAGASAGMPAYTGGAAGGYNAAGSTGTAGNDSPWIGPVTPPATQPSACVAETAIEGGMQRCGNGLLHRVAAGSCPITVPLPERIPEGYLALPDAGLGYDYECRSNADCTQKSYGQCFMGQGGPYCSYGCATDEDCDVTGQLCLCESDVGRCVQASCRTDAACGGNRLCASNRACGGISFGCQNTADECAVDGDCAPGQHCALVDSGDINPLASPTTTYRSCETAACPIPGRPFLVAGTQRSATSVERADWYSPGAAQSLPVPVWTPELRAELRRGWSEQALMEHASVASFARFALQLLSLGAPAELVAAAATAMQDELRHAQDCFRLARRHSDAELGPGPLPVAGALEETDLMEVVLGTVREGCIGETLAALEAAEALQHCEDPEARVVLERIAAEETQHAELAWRFVAWAIDTANEQTAAELRRRTRDLFDRELAAQPDGAGIGGFDRELARHGLLSLPVRQSLRGRALREVVAPCAQALLAPPAPACCFPTRPTASSRQAIPTT